MTGLPTHYQKYIHTSRYARWREDLGEAGRRETWEETVDRYITFFKDRDPGIGEGTWKKLRKGIIDLKWMPSMRCLMTAGPALNRDNVAGYNCSYRAVDDIRAFDEIMYVLLCGTGVGFSVERQEISQLPNIAEEFHESDTTIVVSDSKLGWASAYRELVSLLYAGKLPIGMCLEFDPRELSSRHLEVVLAAQNPLWIYLSLVSRYSATLREGSSHP